MSNWKYKLDISNVWKDLNDKKVSYTEGAKIIAKRIRLLDVKGDYKDDFEELAEGFEIFDSDDVGEFDSLMEQLYDLGDTNVPFTKGYSGIPSKLCWIKTVF